MQTQSSLTVLVLFVLLCVLSTFTSAHKIHRSASSTEKADSSSEESGESKERPGRQQHSRSTTPPTFSCTHLNRTYSLGEHIETPDSPCLHCTCTKRWTKPSGTNCAIIDCPFQYYRSRPHCVTNYVEGKCCPELVCSPPTPGFEIELLSRKKPHTSTDNMVIVAAPGKEVTLYCVAQNEETGPLAENLATWIRRSPNGEENPVQLGGRVIPKFFAPSTWGLLLDDLKDADAGDYVCQVATEPPQSYTTTLRIETRSPSRINACTGPTKVDLAPGKHTCEQFPFKAWYYNESLFMCEEYETRPCKRPENFFSSRRECYSMCGDACYDPKNEGSCDVKEKRYYYDHVKDECNSFVYNGCKGNRNNFQTKEECENTCADVKFRLLDVTGRATPLTEPVDDTPPCQNVECNWHQWTYYMWKGCKAITKPNACCPHRFECPPLPLDEPSEEDNLERPTYWDLGTYHCDTKFVDQFNYSMPHCLNCACDPESKTYVCQGGAQCLDEVNVYLNIFQGCLAVYNDTACCPSYYTCPSSPLHQQRGPHEEFPEQPELRCTHNRRTYPRGYELIMADACTTCTCVTPPDFTCTVQTCPLAPWVTNATLRCEIRSVDAPQCCPEYDCWDIIEAPLVVGKPQTPKELETCDDNSCEEYHTCIVNYTQCYLGECSKTCRMCPTPLCSAGSVLENRIYDCPVCAGYKTPEEACEMNDYCPEDTICRVDEDKCRYEGRCEAMCEIQQEDHIYVAAPVCQTPRCPPTCGFKTVDGCRKCDCSIPRGPIIETPCIKECPQDCGQTVRLDGCLECVCGPDPFFGKPPPVPTKPEDKECLKECPQDCGRTDRGNGCFECHCNVGPFFGTAETPRPPTGANLETKEKTPCASVSCSFPCWAAPAEADGCSKNCLCPKTVEEACTKLECPKESKCTADCEGGNCTPKCEMQLQCAEVLCDTGCTPELDANGCRSLCKCP